MKISLRAETVRDVLLHLGIIISLGVLLGILFFYVYLPMTTNHGETIVVPNVVGMNVQQLEDYLEEHDLEYRVSDSTFDPRAKPLTVFSQFPVAGTRVKTGRSLFVSINALRPPNVKMPNLLNRSLVNAQGELESYGLLTGQVEYVPDLQENAVLKQKWRGADVREGTLVPKGSRIDLVIGDGLGNQEFDVPELVGKPLDEVEIALSGSGLQVGTVVYQTNTTVPAGYVLKQKPEAGKKIRVGEVVDLWVAGSEVAESDSSAGD